MRVRLWRPRAGAGLTEGKGRRGDMNRPEYDVFLSYNGKDEAAVEELARWPWNCVHGSVGVA